MTLLFQLIIIFGIFVGLTKAEIFDGICFYNTLNTPLPVRYLYIQLFDESGKNLTEDSIESYINEELIKVEIIKDNESSCRFRHELLNNFDGTFIFRLRIIVACKSLKINIFSPKKPEHSFCGGPLIIDSPHLLNPEECFCEKSIKQPLPTVTEWIKNYCPLNSNQYKQLFDDLKHFDEINFEKTLQKVESNWGHSNQSRAAAVCRYKLSKNEIKKHCYGEYTGFSMFSDEFLTSLARKMELPEIEFIQNLGDWPLEFSNPRDSGVTIVSWCGSNDTFDIIIPTYEIAESSLKALDILARDMQNIKGQQFIPWSKKFNKAIFRGRDSNEFRLKVAKLAFERPNLIEGGITRYFFFDEKENTKSVEHRPFNEFFKYRYILSIDGTVAAYRLPYLLGGNSVVLKQDSKFYEHFYIFLKPNIHFIPFNEDNLIEKLEFIQTLKNMSSMTSEARIIARENLQPLSIYCYYAMFLQEYSKLYKPPTSERFLNESMEDVPLSPFKPLQTQELCNCNELTDSMTKIDEL